MRTLIYSLIVLLAILHQDFWWRADHRHLVMGFLPISLAYHIGVSIVACILWGLACKYCWPPDLDALDRQSGDTGRGGAH